MRTSLIRYVAAILAILGMSSVTRAVEIDTSSLPHGTEFVPYNAQLTATNGPPPYRWGIVGQVTAWGGVYQAPSDLSNVVAIAAGETHCLALKNDGTVIGWGSDSYGKTTIPVGLDRVVSIAAGEHHSLALQSDGSVVAWGYDDYNYLDVPAGLNDVVSIAVGSLHSLALKSDGTVVAWGGGNYSGELNIPLGLSNVVSIAAGSSHSLALKSDGTVVGWGSNYNGESTIPAGLSGVVSIAAGYSHSLALKSDGTVVGWGNNNYGQSTVPFGLSNVVSVAAGTYHSVALRADGRVVAWGYNNNQQTTVPEGIGNVGFIAAGGHQTLSIRSSLPSGLTLSRNGELAGIPAMAGTYLSAIWVQDGVRDFITGTVELVIDLNPNTRPVIQPTPSQNLVSMDENTEQAFSVSAYDPEGQPLTFAWTWDGSPVGDGATNYNHFASWGTDGMHELRCYVSDGFWTQGVYTAWQVDIEDVPVAITTTALPDGKELVPYHTSLMSINGLSPYTWRVAAPLSAWGSPSTLPTEFGQITAIAAGASHNLALQTDGSVIGWGSDISGQSTVPPTVSNAVEIAAGETHSIARLGNGQVVAWGNNNYGQSTVPAGLINAVSIAAGRNHSIAATDDGAVMAWGYDYYGQSTVPQGVSNAVAVAAGDDHSLVLKSDGTVFAWGDNSWNRVTVPTGLSNVIAIAAGRGHNLALKSDGHVVAWGSNSSGQSAVPAGLSNVVAIAAGDYHSLALTADGAVMAWGYNNSGQTSVPQGLSNVVAIAACSSHSLALLDSHVQLPDGLSLSDEGTLEGTPIRAGVYHVTFIVEDDLGDVAEKQLEMIIEPELNTRPVIDSKSPAEDEISMSEAERLTFSVSAHDPENMHLSYRWTYDDSPVGGSSDSYSHLAPWGSIGSHELRCYVSDSVWTQEVFATWRVDVTNLPLVVTTESLAEGTELEPYSVQLAGTNGPLPYAWRVTDQLVAWGNNGYGQATVPSGVVDVVSIQAGLVHSLALQSDGRVAAWGGDFYGQATIPSGLSNVVAIAAAGYHNLALLKNGRVAAWGSDSFGQSTVPVDLRDVVAIAAGVDHSLAIRDNGTIAAWGHDEFGKTTVPSGLSNVVAIAAGRWHSLALQADGSVFAWGRENQSTVPPGLSNVVAIAATFEHNLALKADGTVVGWGSNYFGESTVPNGLSNVVAVVAANSFSLALMENGTVIGWGSNSSGQTTPPSGLGNVVALSGGLHSLALRSANTQLPKGLSMSSDGNIYGLPVFAGTNSITFVVQDDVGDVASKTLDVVIGGNANTRPVIDATLPSNSAVSMNENTAQSFSVAAHDPEGQTLTYSWTWDGIPVGNNSTNYNHFADWGTIGTHELRCYASDDLWTQQVYTAWQVNVMDIPLAITTDFLANGTELAPYMEQLTATNGIPPYNWRVTGQVSAWGNNDYGQLTLPVELGNVISVSAGMRHNLALKPDGHVIAWGDNVYGQSDVPSGVSNIVSVAAGGYHSLALRSDGRVIGWGAENVGIKVPVVGLENIVAIAAGGFHCLALSADGTVVCWGSNLFGQADVPSGLSNVVAIAAGWESSLALKVDGSVVAWGRNDNGQVTVPPGLIDVVAIDGGTSYSIALHADGTITAWGSDFENQVTFANELHDVVAISICHDRNLALKSDGSVVVWGVGDYNCTLQDPSSINNAVAIAAGWQHNLVIHSSLPTGFTLSPSGTLAGTPSIAGTSLVTFAVQDAVSDVAIKQLEIVIEGNTNTRPVIDARVPSPDEVSMTENSSHAFSVVAHDPEGSPLTFSWTWDGDPVGNDSTNYNHFADWGTVGTHELRCTVSDDLWTQHVFAAWQVDVADIPLTITTKSLAYGTELQPYSTQLSVTNGPLPYEWRVMPQVVTWSNHTWDASSIPTNLHDVIAIAASYSHYLALQADGTVVAWLDSEHANSTGLAPELTPPEGLKATAIATGGLHSLALTPEGTVVAWGFSCAGRLNIPFGLQNVIAIDAGFNYSLALKDDGTVVAWGSLTTIPEGLSNVVAISAGQLNCLALKADGTVVAWGSSAYGVPDSLSNVVAIAAGVSHNLALTSDGTVTAWGSDYYGQVSVPPGLSNVIAIAAGNDHSIALKSDGTLIDWGRYRDGLPTTPQEQLHGVIAVSTEHSNKSLILRSSNTQMPEGLSISRDGLISGVAVTAGTNTVTVFVQDDVDDVAHAALDIVIQSASNTRPRIISKAPSQNNIVMVENTNQLFAISAMDPESQPLHYSWRLNGSSVGSNATNYLLASEFGDAGLYDLRCYVSDDVWSNAVYANWQITVMNDRDADGVSDEQELDLGRDPNNPNDGGDSSSLSGTVRGVGEGIKNAYVALYGASGRLYYKATADNSGRYLLTDIVPGHYFFKVGAPFFKDIWHSNADAFTNAVSYTVPPASVLSNVDFDLLPGQNRARVKVTSDPSGASIYLDGWPVGLTTPATIDVGEVEPFDWNGYQVAPHVISVKKAGEIIPVPIHIQAREAETMEVDFKLTNVVTGALTIQSAPSGAEVYVDYADEAVGTTPMTLGNLEPGTHTVTMRKAGYLLPRPIIASVASSQTNGLVVPLSLLNDSVKCAVEVCSIPTNIAVFVNDLSSSQLTDAIIDDLDSTFNTGTGWYSMPHSITLKHEGIPDIAGRLVPDAAGITNRIWINIPINIETAPDSNGDGLPDWWCILYGLNPYGPSIANELDGSGMTYHDKMLAGLIPGETGSRLRTNGIFMQQDLQIGDRLSFVFESVPGRRYVVQARDDLTDAGWTTISGLILATDYQTVYAVPVAEGATHRFYRIVVLPL